MFVKLDAGCKRERFWRQKQEGSFGILVIDKGFVPKISVRGWLGHKEAFSSLSLAKIIVANKMFVKLDAGCKREQF